MQKIILMVFLAFFQFSFGQNPFSGKVLNKENNLPVVGATIQLPRLEKNTTTDLQGNFSFQELPSGTITMVISSLGFATKTYKLELPVKSEVVILLEPSAIEMEEVIISTPFHQLQSENVMMVERVKMEKLSRAGAAGLAEGISEMAGVSVISTGTGIGKPVIRGLSSNRVLVFTQGVRLENQQFGGEHGLGLSGSGVESVEVIKGPASLLYGSDALGGVLYFNPEEYAKPGETEADVSTTYFTNTRGISANAGYKTSGENLKFLIRGDYSVHSDYKTGTGLRVTNTRFKEYDLKTGIGFRKDFYRGDLRYNYNFGKTGIPEEIGVQSTSKEVLLPYQQVDNHILSLENTFFLRNSSLDLTIGYLFNNRKEFEEHHHEEHPEHSEEEEVQNEGPALEMHLETLNYDLKYNLPEKGNFETIIGFQGMYQSNTNFAEEILIPDAFISDFGIFATTHYHRENYDIQGGLRFDTRSLETEAYGNPSGEKYVPALDKNFNSINGALGFKFDLFENLTSRINFASGFRAPNLAELTSEGVHHGSKRYELGNRELENEQNFQIDLALEFRREHFEAFANAFYNKINNYIYLNPLGTFIEQVPVFEYRQDNAVLYGGEAGFHLHPHPLDWLHFESSFEMVIGKREGNLYLPLIPAHSLINTLRFEFQENGKIVESYSFLSLHHTFEQNQTGIFELPTGSYSLLNAGVGGTLNFYDQLLQVKISGRNLLDEVYFSHLSRLRPLGIPDIGRNISVSLKLII